MAASRHGSPEVVRSNVNLVLDFQPSCLEFALSHDVLIVGTYNLEDAEATQQPVPDTETSTKTERSAQKRTGSLLVFHVAPNTANLHLTKLLPYAILDLHFSPSDPSVLAVATSVGSVNFFACDLEHSGNLTFVRSLQICNPSILVLSLAYQMPDPDRVSSEIAVSLSNGHLAVFSAESEEHDVVIGPVHGQEAWAVTWSRSIGESRTSQVLLYSGGDDFKLCKHSLCCPIIRAEDESRNRGLQTMREDLKTHGAGVTAVVALPMLHEGQEVLLTGSYDEYIRILIMPLHSRGRAKVLSEKRLGGAVWRISCPFQYQDSGTCDSTSFRVIASCMHAGARVLEIRREVEAWSIEVVAMFSEHESMNYASGHREHNGGILFVSTSFYDRRLCIWTLDGTSD